MIGITPQFRSFVKAAIDELGDSEDPAVAYMSQQVPVFVQFAPTPQQARAGGCPDCTYLGLWANTWPGYDDTPHGMIWLFEHGIRRAGGDLYSRIVYTLLHEMEHALQRDHVLDALTAKKRAAAYSFYGEEYDHHG